jgi:hypothetical protein
MEYLITIKDNSMETQTRNHSERPKAVDSADFPFKSLRQTLEILDCSKFYLYKLIKLKKITSYYLEKDENGKGIGKPYFNPAEIAKVLFKQGDE